MAHFRRVVRPAAFGRQPPAAASDERTAGTPYQAPVHAPGSRPGHLRGEQRPPPLRRPDG
ncbi:hypothetical protein [Streptomyces sp. NPDC048720]|uniref:hypothetical protein n=1 Tax=Streptomyces sp. NPDC048720 TaxID=3365588 RepID=UPI003724A3AA